jgi:hypothetical protein
MNKPYHERPDWILKSIGYFCDNYTIDGQDLSKMKRGAIKEVKNNMTSDRLLGLSSFWCSYLGQYFWDCLYWLQGGVHYEGKPWEEPTIGVKCAPWTDSEKREIAKLPRVK